MRDTVVLPKEAVVYEDGAPIAYMVKEATEEPVENEPATRGAGPRCKRTGRTRNKTDCRKKRTDGWILRYTGD